MVSIKQVQEVAQRIINESVELSNLVLLQTGYNKLISKLYELENTETCEHGAKKGECYTEVCSFNRYGINQTVV